MRGAVPAPDWVWERYTPGHAGGGFTDSGPQAQRIQSRERSSAKRCGSERLPRIVFPPPPHASSTRARGLRNAARRPCAWTAHSGRNSGEFRPPFAALNHWRANTALATRSEPRAEQREALRERAVPHCAFPPEPRRLEVDRPRRERAVATHRVSASAPRQRAPRPQLATRLGDPAHGPLTLAGILANSGPRSRLRTTGVQTLPWQRIQSRERSSAKRCGSERLPQHNAVPPPVSTLRAHSLQRGSAVLRMDRSLWPEFWRIPAPVRGSEPLACKHRLGNAFRAASGAARSAAGASGSPQRVSAGASAAGRGAPPAGASGSHAIRFRPPHHAGTIRAHSLQRGSAILRMDRSLWPEFWRIPAPVRGSEPLACKHRLGNAFRAASGAARSAAGASGCPQRVSASTPRQRAPRPQLARRLGDPAHGPLTLAGILANSGPRSRLRTIGVQTLPWQRIQSRERSSAKRCGSERFPQRVSTWASAAGRGPSPAGASGCHSTMPFHPL
jgi:hypothetical protein